MKCTQCGGHAVSAGKGWYRCTARCSKPERTTRTPQSQWPNAGHKPRDCVIYRHDGKWYGTDMTVGCTERVGWHHSFTYVLAQLSPNSLAPGVWT